MTTKTWFYLSFEGVLLIFQLEEMCANVLVLTESALACNIDEARFRCARLVLQSRRVTLAAAHGLAVRLTAEFPNAVVEFGPDAFAMLSCLTAEVSLVACERT